MNLPPVAIKRLLNTCLGCLLGVFLLAGCNYTSERYHPDYHAYRQQIQRVLVLPPEIGIYEETADGSLAWHIEKSRSAQRVAFKAVAEVLAEKNYQVQSTGLSQLSDKEVRSIQTQFRSVNRTIQLETCGPRIYPVRRTKFEYEVGPVDGILEAYQADALVMVVGHQALSSKRPKTWISIAVVEPGGKIIWYGMQGAKQNLDLQATSGALALVLDTLAPFTSSNDS